MLRNRVMIGTDREIPRAQRRGAIIILGMLARARREIMTEKVETLLKIGLGPFGKVKQIVTIRRSTCTNDLKLPSRPISYLQGTPALLFSV